MGEHGLGESVMACKRGDEVATGMMISGREGIALATRTPRQEVVAASTGPVMEARRQSRMGMGMRRSAQRRRGCR